MHTDPLSAAVTGHHQDLPGEYLLERAKANLAAEKEASRQLPPRPADLGTDPFSIEFDRAAHESALDRAKSDSDRQLIADLKAAHADWQAAVGPAPEVDPDQQAEAELMAELRDQSAADLAVRHRNGERLSRMDYHELQSWRQRVAEGTTATDRKKAMEDHTEEDQHDSEGFDPMALVRAARKLKAPGTKPFAAAVQHEDDPELAAASAEFLRRARRR